MNYTQKLREAAERNSSIVSLGMDPIVERIPLEGDVEKKITSFYDKILQAAASEGVLPGAVKPNYAFYAQYGFEGLRALKNVIALCREHKLPVILDAKRADIGKTSEASAREAFAFWDADAVTIAPYMGSDSILPFTAHCKEGRGVYILVRTSNEGAMDLQELEVDGEKVYMKTAAKVIGDWHVEGMGAVVGATVPEELGRIAKFFADSGKDIPLLIPGVGTQGGSAADVAAQLRKSGSELAMHRINSSSAINYAYEKDGSDDFAGAAVRALSALNKEIGF